MLVQRGRTLVLEQANGEWAKLSWRPGEGRSGGILRAYAKIRVNPI
jgi:hypothetical protein